ncbi:MAG: hypothetical protein AAGD05_00985 [Bacteroidota bacterium]
MFAFAVIKFRDNRGLVGLGVLFFSVFGITEISRMMAALIYNNGLREKYDLATDEVLREQLMYSLNNWGLISNTLFMVFILAFALGNLCYGLSLMNETGWSKYLGYGLLFWALLTFGALINDQLENPTLGTIIAINNDYFQPLIRLAIGVWLLWKCRKYQEKINTSPLAQG